MATRSFSIATVLTAKNQMGTVLKNAQAQIDSISRKAQETRRAFSGWGSVMKGMMASQAVTFGLSKIKSGLGFIVDAAQDFENAVGNFIPKFGGDVQKATKFVQELNKAAADTPFQFDDLAKVSDMLMGFGVATSDDVISRMKMLGDVAGGNAVRFNSIALAYSQSMAAGKANMQDMNQLINAGVPILGELAKMYGVNVGQVRNMISSGRVMSEDIDKAFKRMTNSGGMFFRGMEIQSKTFSGKLSTLKDNLKLTAAAIGGPVLDALKPLIDKLGQGAARIKSFMERNSEAIKRFMDRLIQTVSRVINSIARFFQPIFEAVGKAVEKFGGFDAVLGLVEDAFHAVWDAMKFGYQVIDGLLAPFGGLSGVLGSVLKLIRDLLDGWNDLMMALERGKAGIFTLFGLTDNGAEINRTLSYQQWVQAEREARGMTPEKLAAMSPVQKTQYEFSQKVLRAGWEKGKDQPMEHWKGAWTEEGKLVAQKPQPISMKSSPTGEIITATMQSQDLLRSLNETSKFQLDALTKQLQRDTQQKSNIDVNIRVDQEGNVTTANASAKSTGVNLRQAVRFNP